MRAFNRTSTESKCVYRNIFLTESSRYKPHDTIICGLLACAFCCFQRQQRRLHKRRAFFVRVFGVVLKRVFRGQKISGLLFKISGSDFEIRATNFFFAPMWNKRTENQFSIFPPGNSRFCGQVSTGLDAIKAVYPQRRRNYFMAFSPRPYSFRNERSLYAATYALSI